MTSDKNSEERRAGARGKRRIVRKKTNKEQWKKREDDGGAPDAGAEERAGSRERVYGRNTKLRCWLVKGKPSQKPNRAGAKIASQMS